MLEIARIDGRPRVVEPEWASVLFELGASAAESTADDRRRMFAAIVPCRKYAAVLVALGAVLSQATAMEAEPHAWKVDLPPGTHCWFPLGGWFVRCEILSRGADGLLKLRTRANIAGVKSGATISVPENRLNRLLPLTSEEESAARWTARGFRSIVALLGEEKAFSFIGCRTLDSVICGIVGDLVEEAKSLQVRVGSESVSALQLLRPRYSTGERAGYRSEFVSAMTRPKLVGLEVPRLMVFDGDYAFVQWSRVGRNLPCVVILDGSSAGRARFAVAVERLRGLMDRGTVLRLDPPRSARQIEMMRASY